MADQSGQKTPPAYVADKPPTIEQTPDGQETPAGRELRDHETRIDAELARRRAAKT